MLLKFIITFLFAFNFWLTNPAKINRSFTQQDILNDLEETGQETYHFFIDLEHPYFFTASSRLTLYADKNRWAIVFEKSGYANRGFRGEIELTYFGNCLKNLQAQGDVEGVTSNLRVIPIIDNDEIERIENGNAELISGNIKQVRVRDTMVDIEQNKSIYEAKDIVDTIYNNAENLIDIPSMIRLLSEEHPNLFRATDKELRTCLPDDLTKLMVIDAWHHEAYMKYKHHTSPTEWHYETMGKKPGDYQTYKLIADVLASQDTTK